MTVYENIAFGLRMQRADQKRVADLVDRAAQLLHIEPYLDRYPGNLSGGQRQRVAVARALAVEPPVLLMDEPLSNLDALLRLEMRAELKTVLRQAGTTTIYVTHDQTEAMGLADRIAVMHGGKIVQIDTPTEIYRHPKTKFVGGFVGSPPMNFLPVEARGGKARLGGLVLSAPGTDGAWLAGVRPEDFTIVETARGLVVEILVVEPLGSHTLLTARCDGTTVRVVTPDIVDWPVGGQIGLLPMAGRVVWMDPTSERALG
jgi:multiple sugar transport system ATP-binding protein